MKVEIDPFRSTSPKRPVYCMGCDDFRQLVATGEDEYVGHCPVCGRQPGALELGTYPDDPEGLRP